jgi:hypothetical protein
MRGRTPKRGSSQAWRTWHIPLSQDSMTLRAGYASLDAVGMQQRDIPLIVQLVENPKYDLPGVEIFSGATDLRHHDCLHILLGRGLLPKDEAFVLGFTMGSSNRVGNVEERLFALIARYVYPKNYRFDDDDVAVYKDAVRLAYVSDCQPLAEVNLEAMFDWPVRRIRAAIGLEKDLLRAYYAIEARRYPACTESHRLLA